MRDRNLAEGPVHISRVVADMGPLFDVPPDMVRHPDHTTSVAAARGLAPHLSQLHEHVLAALVHDALTDEELENLPQFKGNYSPSTIRKRRSELSLMEPPRVIDTGLRRPNAKGTTTMNVWRAAVRG